MISWDSYLYFALTAIVLWVVAILLIALKKAKGWIDVFSLAGTFVFLCFVILYWHSIERPPMRTMGETRLWFALFIAAIGYIVYKIWYYEYIFGFYLIIAIVFACINIFKPEIHSKTLMPALQSYWFIPHVVAYILSYAMLGSATIMGAIVLYKRDYGNEVLLHSMDKLVYIGFGLLMLGMLMGAVWAKDAWGHYWSWDPKETWAFITVAAYLMFIHLRLQANRGKHAMWVLIAAFVLLMITWKGVNYLPSARNSIHVYSNQ
jgi:ABC-type transport system involved in cytochrome c biogenesis permease subunit